MILVYMGSSFSIHNKQTLFGHSLNGHLRYPNDVDRSLNETSTDKIRKYRDDYNNNPPNAISFIPAIASTSGRFHSEFGRQ